VSAQASPRSDPPLLTVEDLRVELSADGGRFAAVDGVSLTLERGECVALVGESGSGKTQLARAILGLSPASATVSGRVAWEGRDLSSMSETERDGWRGSRAGLVFQEPAAAFDPVRTIGSQIVEAVRLHRRVSRVEARAAAVAALRDAAFPDPKAALGEYAHRLSGGLAQRAYLAAALAAGPSLLVADEPTASLDPTVAARVLERLDVLRAERSLALLLVTHDLALVAPRSDRILVMYAGRIVEEGPHARRARPARPPVHAWPPARGAPDREAGASARRALRDHRRRAAGPLRARRAVRVRAALSRPVRGVRGPGAGLLPGRRGACAVLPARPGPGGAAAVSAGPPPTPGPLLAAAGLEKRFAVRRGLLGRTAGYLAALRGIDFTVEAGRTLALVGESGSGKTTAARIVARLTSPDSGSISFDGADWLALSGAALRRKRRDLQIVFQDPATSLNPRMRAGDQVAEPLRVQRLARGDELRARVRDLLADVGLPDQTAERFPSELSGGQRQRVAIARALATRPRLVVCDEPASALDPSIGAQILNLLLDLRDRTACRTSSSRTTSRSFRGSRTRSRSSTAGASSSGTAADVLARPLHPYTAALVSSASGRGPGPEDVAAPARARRTRRPAAPTGAAARSRARAARRSGRRSPRPPTDDSRLASFPAKCLDMSLLARNILDPHA
jgi:ABC-type glutathione transport system ATPase component